MKTGDELQETEGEARFNAELEAWLDKTEWQEGTTRTKKKVVVNVDSGEVRFEPPNSQERAELRREAEAVARAAKVAASGKTNLAEGLCQRLGKTFAEVQKRHRELEAAARSRQARGSQRREELFRCGFSLA